MDNSYLRPDCSNCAALCCVAFAFDKSQEFAADKAIDEPCRHLAADDRCTIHDDLAAEGYGGCIRFDCHGAGQRVTQALFGSRTWQTEPALLADMTEAFRIMCRIHELLTLLVEAGRLPLPDDREEERKTLIAKLDPDGGWRRHDLEGFYGSGVEAAAARFFVSLRKGFQSENS